MLLWLPLAFLVVAVFGSLVVAAVRGRHLWRLARGVSGPLAEAVDRVAASAALAGEKADALAGAGERFDAARERLRHSVAELAVLQAAAGEVQAGIDELQDLMPRK